MYLTARTLFLEAAPILPSTACGVYIAREYGDRRPPWQELGQGAVVEHRQRLTEQLASVRLSAVGIIVDDGVGDTVRQLHMVHS